VGTPPASFLVGGCACLGLPRRSVGAINHPYRADRSHAPAWERCPRRSLSVVARVWGSHAGAWEPSNIRTMPIVPMLPRGNVAHVAPCRWLRGAWGSHAGAWEPSNIRTMPIVPMLPRGNVARVAPCRWLRGAWGSHAGAWEPSNINHPYRADRSHAPAWERHSRAPCRWLRSAWGSRATGRNVPDRPERTFRVHLRS